MSLKIIFAGTPEFAARSLEALLDSHHEVISVFTQPDRPSGRGRELKPSAVKVVALERGLSVYQPQSMKNESVQDQLKAMVPDLMVVAAYGLILPEAVLKIPRLGCINVHASLLPRWRGAAPIQRAIEAGDQETGITIMQMDAGLDTGVMLWKRECLIGPADTSAILFKNLADLGGEALLEALDRIEKGQSVAESQDSMKATYATKISKQEAELDWKLSAEKLELKVRALNPWPVATTPFRNEPLKIWNARALEMLEGFEPGQIVNLSKQGLEISCGVGRLLITELQLPGKRVQSAADFINAHGSVLKVGEFL